MDIVDKIRDLRNRVRKLETRPRAYVENVIVGGEFDTGIAIPPFFVPFGGSLSSIYGRTLTGSCTVQVRRNGVLVESIGLDVNATFQEVEPAVDLDEGDQLQVVVTIADAFVSGLSVGIVIA